MFVTINKEAVGALCYLGMKLANIVDDNSLSHDDVFRMAKNNTLVSWLDEKNLIQEWDEDDKKVLNVELESALDCIDTESKTGVGVLIAACFLIIQGGGFSRTLEDV